MTLFRLQRPISTARINGAVSASGSLSVAGGGGTGFTTRPYLFQEDKARLVASMVANDPEAFGATTNDFDTPMAFITLMENAAASSGRGSYPITGTYNDIATWQLSIAAWLKNEYSAGSGDTMAGVAKNECMAFVTAHNGTPIISGDEYQHIEDIMLIVAGTVDCCYAQFSSGERATIATWINDCMTYAGTQNRSFWPSVGYPADEEATNNNYHQNHLLALCVAGICSEGWNASASSWRTKFEDWAAKYVADYNGAEWTGAQISEGRYYGQYIRNALWASKLYDSVMGSTWEDDLGASGPSSARQLNLALYHLQPNLRQFFHDGSEANDTGANINTLGYGTLHHYMSSIPSSTDARVAKTILTNSTALSGAYSWARSVKGFENFYFSIRPISALAVSNKTDRKLSLPSPGGARVFIRSSSSWGGSSTDRAALMFFGALNWVNDSGYSHANPDVPGFQWTQGPDKIACDVEQDAPSGIAHEAGSSIGSAWGNYVGLASDSNPPSVDAPVILYDEDNTGAGIPHYYQSVNAQPSWSNATTYRRQYVWLDDLQVVCIHDRVVTAGSDTKTWRLHSMALPSVAGSTATWTVGATSARVRDLYTTDATSMSAADVTDADSGASVNRLSQTGTSNDWRSLKVLDLNSRCSAATLGSGSGYLEAQMTINGASVTVRFFDDGSHVTVS